MVKSSKSSGIIILVLGLVLLLVTFIVASVHLYAVNGLPVPSLMSPFGMALSSLFDAAIRILYLGAMGWMASTVIAKGIAMLFQSRLPSED